jgi:hypothetical protein
VKASDGKSSGLSPGTAIDPPTEKIYKDGALRFEKGINPKEGLIQGGNRLKKGAGNEDSSPPSPGPPSLSSSKSGITNPAPKP